MGIKQREILESETAVFLSVLEQMAPAPGDRKKLRKLLDRVKGKSLAGLSKEDVETISQIMNKVYCFAINGLLGEGRRAAQY